MTQILYIGNTVKSEEQRELLLDISEYDDIDDIKKRICNCIVLISRFFEKETKDSDMVYGFKTYLESLLKDSKSSLSESDYNKFKRIKGDLFRGIEKKNKKWSFWGGANSNLNIVSLRGSFFSLDQNSYQYFSQSIIRKLKHVANHV